MKEDWYLIIKQIQKESNIVQKNRDEIKLILYSQIEIKEDCYSLIKQMQKKTNT